eukprot:2518911-Alexandrium_andersonii.AAC.1
MITERCMALGSPRIALCKTGVMLETQCIEHNASKETEDAQKAKATLNTWATVHRKQTARAALPKTC